MSQDLETDSTSGSHPHPHPTGRPHLLEDGRRAAVEVVVRAEPLRQLAVGLPERTLVLAGVHEEEQVLGAELAHGGRVGQRRHHGRVHPQRVLDDVLALPVPLVRVLELCAADAAGAGRGEGVSEEGGDGEGSGGRDQLFMSGPTGADDAIRIVRCQLQEANGAGQEAIIGTIKCIVEPGGERDRIKMCMPSRVIAVTLTGILC